MIPFLCGVIRYCLPGPVHPTQISGRIPFAGFLHLQSGVERAQKQQFWDEEAAVSVGIDNDPLAAFQVENDANQALQPQIRCGWIVQVIRIREDGEVFHVILLPEKHWLAGRHVRIKLHRADHGLVFGDAFKDCEKHLIEQLLAGGIVVFADLSPSALSV